MTFDDGNDPLLRALRRLPGAEPDAARDASVRGRCRATLVGRRRRDERQAHRAAFARRVLEPALVGGLCLVYLAEVLRAALQLRSGL
jgi:hypothetical protein